MELIVGNTYNFDTIAPDVLGDNYTDMKLLAIINFDVAMMLGYNVLSKHKQVFNISEYDVNYTIPSSYNYLLFETKNNDKVIMGETWIKESSLSGMYGINATFDFSNISINDLEIITSQLNPLGYSDISVTLK